MVSFCSFTEVVPGPILVWVGDTRLVEHVFVVEQDGGDKSIGKGIVFACARDVLADIEHIHIEIFLVEVFFYVLGKVLNEARLGPLLEIARAHIKDIGELALVAEKAELNPIFSGLKCRELDFDARVFGFEFCDDLLILLFDRGIPGPVLESNILCISANEKKRYAESHQH